MDCDRDFECSASWNVYASFGADQLVQHLEWLPEWLRMTRQTWYRAVAHSTFYKSQCTVAQLVPGPCNVYTGKLVQHLMLSVAT